MKKILLSLLLVLGLCVPAWAANEDFTDSGSWTEVDPSGHKTLTTTRVTNSGDQSGENAYVVRDMGADQITDFSYNFDIQAISAGSSGSGETAIFSISNTSAPTRTALDTSNVGVYVWLRGNNTLHLIDTAADTDTHYDSVSWDTTIYCTLARSGSSVTLKIYSNADRAIGNLVDTLTATVSTAYRYMGVEGDGYETLNSYLENLDLGITATCDTDCSLCDTPDVPRACIASAKPCYYTIEDGCSATASTFKTEIK